jgi:hypothetical protein
MAPDAQAAEFLDKFMTAANGKHLRGLLQKIREAMREARAISTKPGFKTILPEGTSE